jgi:hypothetical protein
MFSFRDVVIFAAGAEFFHTLSHMFLGRYVTFPLHTSIVELTHSMNTGAIVVNGIITLVLIGLAIHLKKK